MASDNVFIPKQGALADLAGWIAGDLGGSQVRLYVSNTVYTPDRVPGDYTEASFTGYAPQLPTWGVPFTNGSGEAETDSNVLTWTFTGGAGSFRVFGIYIVDGTGTKLLAVIPFVNPVDFTPGNPTFSSTVQLTAVSKL